jgi:hypothetical protein
MQFGLSIVVCNSLERSGAQKVPLLSASDVIGCEERIGESLTVAFSMALRTREANVPSLWPKNSGFNGSFYL